MPLAPSNGIELWYDTFGTESDPAMLLIMGLGGQAIAWDDDLCRAFAGKGHFVIRFDNRDVGLSTKIEGGPPLDVVGSMLRAMAGETVEAPYLLSDMAADAAGLLDHLGVRAAHVVGVSMGGMIAQVLAIEHPDRVLSLTSIMSTTGDLDVGMPTEEALPRLMLPPPKDRDEAIANGLSTWQVLAAGHYDEQRTRVRVEAAYDRSFYPVGTGRQLLAVMASGSRTEGLRQLDVPTLVIHGTADPLVTPSGGKRTAEVIPGARLLLIEGMGHDTPPVLWDQLVDAITDLAASVPAAS